MNIRYCGSREAILSVSAAWSKVIRSREGIWYTAKEDGAVHIIEEVTVCEGAWENNPPLDFEEWRYTLNDSCVFIEGAGISALVNAVRAFLKTMEQAKAEPISCHLTFGHKPYVLNDHLTLGNTALSRYRIYYKQNEYKIKDHEDFLRFPPARMAAEDLAVFMGETCGTNVTPLPLTSETDTENAIVIAPLEDGNRYGDWRLESQGGTLFILANDIYGWESGVSALCDCFASKSFVPFPIKLCGSVQAREEYTQNPDAFRPCYGGQRKRNILSIEEKTKKLSCPTDDVFVIAHRGEHTYYPENSLEASLSAWCGNADAVEMDLSLTRDGVFVLMHDENLTRTTDAEGKLGKNGLPDSTNLSDWSLDELRQLRLKDSYGRTTDFLIPTLEEIFKVCDGRILIHLDKKFDYKNDIFPLMRKLGTYRCLYLCNRVELNEIPKLKGEFADQGITLPTLYRIPQQGVLNLERSMKNALESKENPCPAVVFINDYHRYLPHHRKIIAAYKGKLRIATWMMWETDSPYYWRESNDLGFNAYMSNFPLRLIKYFSKET